MPTCTLAEAAARCGYRRKATFREKHLDNAGRISLNARYDDRGRLILDASAVERLALSLEMHRQARGNWRVDNLGRWARPGRRSTADDERE